MKYGILYTYDNNTSIFKRVLQQLELINDIDIVIVSNTKVDSKFDSLISNNNTYGHVSLFNNILQGITHLIEKGDCTNVSFIEHDVLYNSTHFDYDMSQDCCNNNNHIGASTECYQKCIINYRPLYSMSMKIELAKYYVEKRLYQVCNNEILYRLEPDTSTDYNSIIPIIHLKSGNPFTSYHYAAFEDTTETIHEYWGDISNLRVLTNS